MAPVDEAVPEALVDTILFVDVDGVLNVGIYDPFDAPILLKSSELSMAREIVAMDYRGFDSATAYKICALAATPADPESTTTFEALASQDQLSKVLVGRLSELIQEAGPKCHVVLSSSWRKKQHLKRRQRLELDLSEALGRYFTFHDVTQLTPELHAGDRLQTIRSYLQDFAAANLCGGGELKVIVVDDFFLSPLSYADPFRITGGDLHTLEEVEDFLLQPLDEMGIEASAKVLHCYRKVTTSNGLVLQVGMGLSNGLLKDAKEFLSNPNSPEAMKPPPYREPPIEKSFFHLLATFA